MSRQMLLDLGHRAALGREDFLVSPGNRDAVAWLDAWPDWPTPGLVVVGPAASGKSHLAEVWRAHSGAVRLSAAEIAGREAPALLQEGRNAVVEDADGGVDQESLLHLYNEIAERRGHILLTARQTVPGWGLTLADLRSRVAALPSVALGQPDDELIQAVLVKLFADRQLRVDPDLVAYLAPRVERSLATVAKVVAALDAAALAARSRITVRLAGQVLREQKLID
jgi:chromosomal replication initiation ATPase DnaA